MRTVMTAAMTFINHKGSTLLKINTPVMLKSEWNSL
jgi:hypothetical protein